MIETCTFISLVIIVLTFQLLIQEKNVLIESLLCFAIFFVETLVLAWDKLENTNKKSYWSMESVLIDINFVI